VFDADGKRVAICSLPPTLVNSQTQVGCIAVSADGRVHVGLGGFEISEYVVFEANGASAGDERVAGESHFAPSSSLRWSMRYKQIDVFDGSELRKSITRSPDNKWLDAGSDAGVSADGSLALLSRGKLHVYSGDGEPVMSLDAPGIPDYASIAFADARVFLGTSSELWCVDLVTHATRNATLGEGLTADSQTCMAWRADVSELWILDESAKKVLRYRVPR
jgi:hypothetical protein